MPTPFLSIVIPVYNEEESLDELHRRLAGVGAKIEGGWEVIFVNDGSADASIDVLRRLVAADAHVRVVNLSRNFGHQMALTAGLDHAAGDVIVMMDADLQDPPELIPKMIAKWREGFDVVYAVRRKRRGETAFKKATAAAFYRLLRTMTRIEIPVDTGDFRLISRRALDSLKQVRERSRYLRGLFAWIGYRQAPVYYVRAPRFAGETKFPMRRMVRFAIDAITSFSAVPLQFATWLGFFAASVGFLYGLRVLYEAITGGTVAGWASLMVVTLFFGGVQLLTLGILGEYVGRIFDEVKQRPLYLASEKLGFEAPPPAAPKP